MNDASVPRDETTRQAGQDAPRAVGTPSGDPGVVSVEDAHRATLADAKEGFILGKQHKAIDWALQTISDQGHAIKMAREELGKKRELLVEEARGVQIQANLMGLKHPAAIAAFELGLQAGVALVVAHLDGGADAEEGVKRALLVRAQELQHEYKPCRRCDHARVKHEPRWCTEKDCKCPSFEEYEHEPDSAA